MKNTYWEKISSIAEIVSSVAIVITLVYLAVQTQQNNELLRSQTNQAYMEQRLEQTSVLYGDNEVAGALFKAMNGEELSQLEAFKLNRYYQTTFNEWEWEFQQYQQGLLEPHLSAWNNAWRTWPGFQDLYHSLPYLTDDFKDFMAHSVINQ